MIKNIIDITKLKPTLACINNGKDTVLVTGGGSPFYEYKDNQKTDKILGYEYPVLMPGLGFERFSIKVVGQLAPSITEDKFLAAETPLLAKIEGYSGKLYKTREGAIALSATATAIKLV